MSKPIPQEEYNRKPLTRLMQWISGDIDPFLETMEVSRQKAAKPNERLIRKHRRDQDAVIRLVHDAKHNRVYKNFRRFYKVASVICCLALVLVFLWLASPVSSHLISRLEVVTNEHLAENCELPADKWEDELS